MQMEFLWKVENFEIFVFICNGKISRMSESCEN